MYQASPKDGSAPVPPTLLLISGERVGAALVATHLRARGHRVLTAETAAQGVARLTNGRHGISAIVIVGRVRDATPDALRRWADRHGYADLPIAAVGCDTAAEPEEGSGKLLSILADDWPHRVDEVSGWFASRTELPERATAS
ncbi:MAG: hypothetical protein J7513_05465 [Solirubrobacteraceae bacterium]|nr:hypothetical protein [Solirubrobacteraceae bacterium]